MSYRDHDYDCPKRHPQTEEFRCTCKDRKLCGYTPDPKLWTPCRRDKGHQGPCGHEPIPAGPQLPPGGWSVTTWVHDHDETWRFLVVSFDESQPWANQIKVYLDGKVVMGDYITWPGKVGRSVIARSPMSPEDVAAAYALFDKKKPNLLERGLDRILRWLTR